jgi:hypothetical protein
LIKFEKTRFEKMLIFFNPFVKVRRSCCFA